MTASATADPPIEFSQRWYRFADPGGQGFLDRDNGITCGESSQFDPTGQLILTSSKADGRLNRYVGEDLTGGTAHLRLWDLQGNLLWDKKRSRGPDNNGDGRPDDQPSDGEDEIEVATFRPDGLYVAAGSEDDDVEVWRIRDLATGALLADPVLERTLTEANGAIDGMMFSHSGELLLTGTEEAGKVEVWRTTGPPSTWVHLHQANHGGTGNQAVNSVGLTTDDRYVGTAGTNTNAKFWRLDVTRDPVTDEITAATMVELAHMTHPTGSSKEARFESVTDRQLAIGSVDGSLRIYDVQGLLDGTQTDPIQTLHNDHTVEIGNEVEPAGYSRDGRFVLQGGGPSGDETNTYNGPYGLSFFRVYETAEILPGAPEPDPVWVERVYHTEYFDFNQDDSLMATGHEDGTVRLWDVTVSGSQTIAAEAFNELTDTHSRWTLGGSRSTVAGDDEWGVAGDEENNVVRQNETTFLGHRGYRFLAADNLTGETHSLTLNDPFDLSSFAQTDLQRQQLQVHFAAAANDANVFETGDFLRLVADLNGGDDFETLLAEFTPNAEGDLALDGTGEVLTLIFTDFHVDLAPLLPADFDRTIRFRIEANTDSSDEELAFDSLHVWGIPLTGDANDDGAVTDADYTLWADHYGAASATVQRGDFNGDDKVTDADYTLWADNYGAGGGAVPEPASLAALGLGGLALLRRRSRHTGP